MKQLIAAIFLLLVLTATAHGQAEGKRSSEDQLVRMQKNLGLTDEQVAQLREIGERGGGREEIRAVFTDEQWALMQERRRQAKARRGKGQSSDFYALPPEPKPEEPDGG